MNATKRAELRLLSRCLAFPDEEAMRALSELNHRARSDAVGEDWEASLARLRRHSLMQLQEAYSQAFDLNAETCLYLTYHKYGEGYQRQEAMAQLNRLYSELSGEAPNSELPDYLPLVLEFLSLAPERVARVVVEEYRDEINALGKRLADSGNVYACLLQALSRSMEAL